MRKKLVEVALPLDAINEGCEEDKNRKVGHIRNLHKWFAPMPLPAWRTLLFASVIDDPGQDMEPRAAEEARRDLFDLIRRLAPLDAYKDAALMSTARKVLREAVGDGSLPTVVDPFCGGGSTIVEAQRLGFPTLGSDLNPIATVITMTLCRLPQLVGDLGPVNPEGSQETMIAGTNSSMHGLLGDVRYYAIRVMDLAWKRIGHLYPAGPLGEKIFAWRWAWSVRSPDPALSGAYTPLVTDWRLVRGAGGNVWVQPEVHGTEIAFQICREGGPPAKTAGGNSARCIFTNQPISAEYIRQEARAGRLTPRMICVLGKAEGGEKVFLAPSEDQLMAANARVDIELPDLELPERALGFRVQAYGFKRYRDLFMSRQAIAVATFSDIVSQLHGVIEADAIAAGLPDDTIGLQQGGRGACAYADAVATILGICVDRLAVSNNILVQWFSRPTGFGKGTPAFRMQTLSMVWDFVETNPFALSVGGWLGPVLESALAGFSMISKETAPATVLQSDARTVAGSLPSSAVLVATDPPYYDSIGYADLSDFFYIWLRRSLRVVYPKVFGTVATPKASELIATPFRHEGGQDEADEYFRKGFEDTFRDLRSRMSPDYPLLVIYALKQKESSQGGGSTGWEVFLDGLLSAGFAVVATWPIRTTTLTRSRGIGSNALANAICVVCRPRPKDAEAVTRRELIRKLRSELPTGTHALMASSIAPVDLAQASIGPGMAIYSGYKQVLEADGSKMSVRAALQSITEVVDEIRGEEEAELDRETRFAMTWFETHQYAEGAFGEADTLAKARNVSVVGVQEAGLLESTAGRVRLYTRAEMPGGWNPESDSRPTVWEATQHLIKRLDQEGEAQAAALLSGLGHTAEQARNLAYRLYNTCERKGWAAEAQAYNGLVLVWPELEKLAREIETTGGLSTQAELFE